MKAINNPKSTMLSLGILLSIILISACTGKKDEADNKDNKLLTERIQYDVLIKTPDPEMDWWVQNIEGSKRESFIKTFLNLAYDGKVKAYDYFNNPLTPEQVKNIDNRVDTVSVPDPKNPEVNKDTVIKLKLDMQKITKVRFLEEWSFDEKKMNFDKKVVGLMLMKENYDEKAELRGYSPLFWLYFDDSYPAKLK
jgi:hypothetical protein